MSVRDSGWTDGTTRPRIFSEESPWDRREFAVIWSLSALTYVVGDAWTTLVIIRTAPALTEANVIVAATVATFGEVGLVGAKLVVLAVCLAISLHGAEVRDRFLYYQPPIVTILVGSFLTAYNVRLLLG